ncbi:MAG: membrane dipeptidase [Firmicutes bacterium]|nr:membrane dipeptidase [Bacillota bacterium]
MRADCHCDTALFLLREKTLRELPAAHLDWQRVRRYLDIATMALFVNEAEHPQDAPAFFHDLLTLLLRDISASGGSLELLLWREQLAQPRRPLLLLSSEGASCLGREGKFLDEYFASGLRALGFTWNGANAYAGGCRSEGRLTAAGKRLLRRCEEKGILVDLAHANKESFWQAVSYAGRPLFVSHTCCAALHAHPRNLDDDQLKAVADCGGVTGMCFVPEFLGGAGDLRRLCEHIEYAAELVGSEHVALGSDWDGCRPHPSLAGAEKLPAVYAELAARGMPQKDIDNIAGGSMAALLRRVLPQKPGC